jgi:adenosine deaminase
MDKDFDSWLAGAPKCELHLHIDGTLQPRRLLQLADKHCIELPYGSEADIEAACAFTDLQSFLDLYYRGAAALRDEEDFYHLMLDYLMVCRDEHIVHTEIMVEPQAYAPQGVPLAAVMAGFGAAIDEARAGWGQSVGLILSFLRHLPEAEALAQLDAAEPWRERFVAIGLASAERDHPPAGFEHLYAAARDRGYRLTAHAGEEGPAAFVADALDVLKVERVDHGVRAVEDPALVARLAREAIPLTVCPLSNVRLRVFDSLAEHTLPALQKAGVRVTVNSDDPAYFGGYLTENFRALHRELGLDIAGARELLGNAIDAAFLPASRQASLREALAAYGTSQRSPLP